VHHFYIITTMKQYHLSVMRYKSAEIIWHISL